MLWEFKNQIYLLKKSKKKLEKNLEEKFSINSNGGKSSSTSINSNGLTKGSKENIAQENGAANTRNRNQNSIPSSSECNNPNKTSTSRLLREMSGLRKLGKNRNPDIDIFVTDNLFFWKALMSGPIDTPYFGGIFELYLKFPETYPSKPPDIRFVTECKHCNVNTYGKICHSVLDRNWHPDRTAVEALNFVYGLLMTPDYDDPLDSVLALQARTDPDAYRQSIVDHTAKHAQNGTREELKKKWGVISKL